MSAEKMQAILAMPDAASVPVSFVREAVEEQRRDTVTAGAVRLLTIDMWRYIGTQNLCKHLNSAEEPAWPIDPETLDPGPTPQGDADSTELGSTIGTSRDASRSSGMTMTAGTRRASGRS